VTTPARLLTAAISTGCRVSVPVGSKIDDEELIAMSGGTTADAAGEVADTTAAERGAGPRSDHDLVVVANRLPVDLVESANGAQWRTSPGGLVSALAPVMRRAAGAWVGWSGSVVEAPAPFDLLGMRLVGVPLSAEEVADFYEGFSNATLWPLYHDVIVPPRFERSWWDAYVRVNERFAAVAAAQAGKAVLPGARMVIKGGSFLCSPDFCVRYRASAREAAEADLGTAHIGFRTVRREAS
jgi:hypothetical protein